MLRHSEGGVEVLQAATAKQWTVHNSAPQRVLRGLEIHEELVDDESQRLLDTAGRHRRFSFWVLWGVTQQLQSQWCASHLK